MREILFKAKRKDDGKWFKGDYQKRYDSFGRIEHLIFYSKSAIVWEYAEIDTDTICQYTELNAYWDEEEASVWEHDLLEVDYRGNKVIAEVKYECGMFILASDKFVDSYIPLFDVVQVEDIGWVDAKVIGNIFDNPELLEGN